MPKSLAAYRPKKSKVPSLNVVKKDVLRKIAHLKCMGRSAQYISKNIGMNYQKTIRLLSNPYTKKYIKAYRKDMLRSSELKFQALYSMSLDRLETIIAMGDDEFSLKAINMLWEAQNRFPKEEKGGSMNDAMIQQLMQQGGAMMQGIAFKGPNEVDKVMSYLDQTRDVIEVKAE